MRMRRISSRKVGKRNTILIAIILVIVVFVCSTGYAFLSQRLSLQGTANLSGDNPYCKLDLFEGYKEFEVDYEYIYYMNHQEYKETPHSNPNNENVDVRVTIKITNTGTQTVTAWRAFALFPVNTTVTNYWNALNVYEGEAKNGEILVYDYPSIYYNNTIEPGQTVTFNVDYSTTASVVEISEITVYGWDLSTETVPELEDMAACIYDGNSSGGDNSGDESDGETGGDNSGDESDGETGGDNTGNESGGETGGDNTGTESGGETGGDNTGTESGGETGGDNTGTESGGETGGETDDDNIITSSDGKITASVENRYQQDSDGLSYYATVITLTNNTEESISNWYIKLDVGEGGAIPGCWTATCTQTDGIVTITPPTWGVNLEPGNPYTVEFQTYTKQVEPKVIETGILE